MMSRYRDREFSSRCGNVLDIDGSSDFSRKTQTSRCTCMRTIGQHTGGDFHRVFD